MPGHVDGNALAGPLSEIFDVDMTMAIGRCSSCGDASRLALAMVYPKPNTFVVRCHVCDAVLFTLIQYSDRNEIDLTGIDALQLAR
ncbi:MAG TPA: DUF6510 family protein [Galbitalea sp.]|jgi:hypothetical protein